MLEGDGEPVVPIRIGNQVLDGLDHARFVEDHGPQIADKSSSLGDGAFECRADLTQLVHHRFDGLNVAE